MVIWSRKKRAVAIVGPKRFPTAKTKQSWGTRIPDAAPMLVDTFLQEIDGLAPEEIQVIRVGLKLSEASQKEMMSRLRTVIEDYAMRDPEEDGVATSLFLAHHLDVTGNTPADR